MRREVKVGLYALLMLIALYWGINFLRGKDIFNRTDTYYATYDQVNGIQQSSAIVIKGFKVGVVGDIKYDPRRSDMIVLEFNINSKYKIPENSQARIFSDGLLGGKAIEIVLGNSERFLNNRDTLHSSADKDILELAGSELEVLKQKVTEIADNLTRTLRSLNGILEDNSASIKGTMDNLSQMTASLNHVITGERENLRSIVANINSLAATLARNAGTIDTLMADLGGFGDKLSAVDVEAIGNNLTESLEKLNAALSPVSDGSGTLGKLMADDGLYDSLTETMENLSALLEDLRANPGKYVNITVFGSRNNK